MPNSESERAAAIAAEVWSERLPDSDTFARATYWLAIPAVRQRCNLRATGDRSVPWYAGLVRDHLGVRLPVERMLSLGCGIGNLERALYGLNAYRRCTGIDIAPGAIDEARRLAAAEGIEELDYEIGDLNTLQLPEATYDAVWFDMALHHVHELERLLDTVRRSLKPGGFLFAHEYVGADRFGFGARQRAALIASHQLIPRPFRRNLSGHGPEYLDDVGIPDPEAVRLDDPSESVRSSEILGAIRARYDLVALHRIGGSILQYGLNHIAGNFRDDEPASMRVLEMLFAIEDALITTADIPCDFVSLAARPRA